MRHGGCYTTEYKAWESMLGRCYCPGAKHYKNYGGRGIGVCERWRHSFPNFLVDMGNKPSSKHSLDRIDGEKGYSPENCRWATRSEQAVNRRTTRFITFEGLTMPMKHWARRLNVNYRSLVDRLDAGWSIEDALTKEYRR